jgi:methylmalonyl-CoA epimerase
MRLPDRSIGTVEHIGLAVDDLDAAHSLFSETLLLPTAPCRDGNDRSAFAVRAGDTVLRLVSTDAPEASLGRRGCNHLAFRVPSLAAARERLEALEIRCMPSATTGSGGRSAIWTAPTETIGIPVQFVEETAPLEFPPHANGAFIERADHVGVAARDHTHARAVFSDAFGFPVESTQVDSEVFIPVQTTSNDKYGSKTHAGTPIPRIGSGLMAVFITVGDFDLEIMQPLGDALIDDSLGRVPGSVGQDQSAIAKFLERRGEGLLHVCFKTPDIDAALKHVADNGVALIDPIGRPGGRNGQIAFMEPQSTAGVLMHFVERTPI